jgi:hypothetical protein
MLGLVPLSGAPLSALLTSGVSATVTVTGVSATGELGTSTVAAKATVSPTGVSATGELGTATVGLAVSPTGVSATGELGTATVTIQSGATVSPTGRPIGGSLPQVRYRTEKEVRDERIARGIIPPDEPEIQTIVEASKAPSPTLAKRRLRELVEGHIRLAELDRMLAEVIQAQQIADEFAYQAMLQDLQQAQNQLTNLNNRNAVLIMLGLL